MKCIVFVCRRWWVRLHGVRGLGTYFKRAMMQFIGLFGIESLAPCKRIQACGRVLLTSLYYYICTPDDSPVSCYSKIHVG